MSEITKIEDQKNKKRVNIFVDDAFFCGLHKEIVVIFGLKVGKNIDEKALKQAVFESEVKMAFEKAMDYLSLRMHTQKELFEKLLKKGYEKDIIEKAIEKLEEYHYIDDNLFARQFIEQNKKYSKKMLENKLKAKGISTDITKTNMTDRQETEELELCLFYASKYAKNKDVSSLNGVQKMYASLSRKGFSFETIKKACSKVIPKDSDIDEIDVSD